MNFFFALNFNNCKNFITIPKFTSEGTKLKDISLFSAKINNDKWQVRKQFCKEDEKFFYLNVLPQDLGNVFF
jgi:hypothetical protein